ncbi:hypothetical protein [Bradyrhizobium sp. CCBAU 45389]|uniref:hypothetical protein n=1 Tax=Bradyrhizobium sp. CCBAU 45389 TaxID=858429 RepID=UPI0023050E73|nr:hypothetical protein [Bradyrhizobium sp. CCBAU 45389]
MFLVFWPSVGSMLRAERQARFGSIIAHPWRGFGSGRANRYHPSDDLVLGRDDGFASATPFEDFDDLDIDLPTVDIRFQQRASARTGTFRTSLPPPARHHRDLIGGTDHGVHRKAKR